MGNTDHMNHFFSKFIWGSCKALIQSLIEGLALVGGGGWVVGLVENKAISAFKLSLT